MKYILKMLLCVVMLFCSSGSFWNGCFSRGKKKNILSKDERIYLKSLLLSGLQSPDKLPDLWCAYLFDFVRSRKFVYTKGATRDAFKQRMPVRIWERLKLQDSHERRVAVFEFVCKCYRLEMGE